MASKAGEALATRKPPRAKKGGSNKRAPEAKILRITKPDMESIDGKAVVRLAQSDILFSSLQIIREGGDNNLHSHAGMDGLWFVLKGRARFYGTEEDIMLAELDIHEGIFIPRGFPYWFEKIGEDDLELLQVEAIDRSVKNERINHRQVKDNTSNVQIYRMDGSKLTRGFMNPGLDKPAGEDE